MNIAGATSASYTTPATTTYDSGSTFSVAVSNSAASITSNPATLTVNASSNCLNSSATTWTNTSFPAQAAQFTATYDATPNQNNMDGVIGLSFNAATGYRRERPREGNGSCNGGSDGNWMINEPTQDSVSALVRRKHWIENLLYSPTAHY